MQGASADSEVNITEMLTHTEKNKAIGNTVQDTNKKTAKKWSQLVPLVNNQHSWNEIGDAYVKGDYTTQHEQHKGLELGDITPSHERTFTTGSAQQTTWSRVVL